MKIAALSYSCSRVLGFLPKYKFYFFFFSVVIPFKQFLTIFFVKNDRIGGEKTWKFQDHKENHPKRKQLKPDS